MPGGAARMDLTTRLGPLSLRSPLVAASGTVGSVADFAGVARLEPYGAAVAKSVSEEPWPGRPPPRLYPTGTGLLNGIGIQNPGVAAWAEEVGPRLAGLGVPVWGSVVGKTAEEFGRVAAVMQATGVAAIEVNLSCPNLEDGLMFALDPAAAGRVVTEVRAATTLPVGAKLSPNCADIVAVAAAACDRGAPGTPRAADRRLRRGTRRRRRRGVPPRRGPGGGAGDGALRRDPRRRAHHPGAAPLRPEASCRPGRRPHRSVDPMDDRRVIVALDLHTAEEAVRLARLLAEHVAGFKVGLGLLHGPGPGLVGALARIGPVLADAKLHDIPSQVERAARRLGEYGARWVTAHASGGVAMLRAAHEGLAAGAGGRDAGVLAVTVLTSIDAAEASALFGRSPGQLTARLARRAAEAGVEG
ncbi:MAG: dihydroorotate oxidase catalytic subunit, partial [Acidobacteria bacterium]|nr:dihydroorotate oxidase catalytic subunit [Acidobacteriota bacterium]